MRDPTPLWLKIMIEDVNSTMDICDNKTSGRECQRRYFRCWLQRISWSKNKAYKVKRTLKISGELAISWISFTGTESKKENWRNCGFTWLESAEICESETYRRPCCCRCGRHGTLITLAADTRILSTIDGFKLSVSREESEMTLIFPEMLLRQV